MQWAGMPWQLAWTEPLDDNPVDNTTHQLARVQVGAMLTTLHEATGGEGARPGHASGSSSWHPTVPPGKPAECDWRSAYVPTAIIPTRPRRAAARTR